MKVQYGVFELTQQGLVQAFGTGLYDTEAEALFNITKLIESDNGCSWIKESDPNLLYTIQTLYSKE